MPTHSGSNHLSLATLVALTVLCLAPFLDSQENHPPPQDDSDRPLLTRQPVANQAVPDPPVNDYVHRLETSRTEAAPGLALPNAGHVWALDKFDGRPELIQLKYTDIVVNGHGASNTVKANLAPFVYKPKMTWEVPGAAAVIRLHDATPSIFFLSVYDSEDAANPAAKWGNLGLVRLQVHGNKRIVSTTAFTQITAKAKRSEELIETVTEEVGHNGWYKIYPKRSLSSGEYAFVRLPKQANVLGATIFDFAVDPAAPQNSNAVLSNPQKND